MKMDTFNCRDDQKIDMFDIVQLHQWIDLFLSQRAITRNENFVRESNLSSWKDNLKSVSRKELAIGFVNFAKLVDVVLKNKLGVIPISPTIFKTLCYQKTSEKADPTKSKIFH